MKTIYLLAGILLVTACRKEQNNNPQGEKIYHCLCETKTTFVDHCGRDSSLASMNVSANNEAEAKNECAQNNMSASNSYSITNRTCELK